MKKLFLSFLALGLTLSSSIKAETFYPEVLLELDKFFSHHIIVAEKNTHKLYLYKNEDGFPKLVKAYQMATGKKAGNKFFQGDHRTPEGVYYLTDFLTHKDLINRHGKQGDIYGVGAFVLNYPNPIDSRNGKTGGGIWLHSTNDETRIEKGLDSRGCIVTANTHLIDIARYIELNRTQVVVVHELKYLSETAWKQRKTEINNAISDWIYAWKEENFKDYIASYHKDFYDSTRGGLTAFSQYKRAVFSMEGKPKIGLSNLSVIYSGDYAVATFKQSYQSNTIKDLGRKTLYMKRDEFYKWKIVAENWSKHGLDAEESTNEKVAFVPSMRFFETDKPEKIMGDRLVNMKTSSSMSQNN